MGLFLSEKTAEDQTVSDTGDCLEELLLTENTFPTGKTILSLPPEIIVEILLFCPEDVVNVAKALATKNQDIWDVIANEKLWKNAVIPPKNRYIEYLGSHTKSLLRHSQCIHHRVCHPRVCLHRNIRLRHCCHHSPE